MNPISPTVIHYERVGLTISRLFPPWCTLPPPLLAQAANEPKRHSPLLVEPGIGRPLNHPLTVCVVRLTVTASR